MAAIPVAMQDVQSKGPGGSVGNGDGDGVDVDGDGDGDGDGCSVHTGRH